MILEELLFPYGLGTMPLSANHRESEVEDDLDVIAPHWKNKLNLRQSFVLGINKILYKW